MAKIKMTPRVVRPMSLYELFSEWASGKMSDAPIYNKKPAKNPKYKVKSCDVNVKNIVEINPKIGADECFN